MAPLTACSARAMGWDWGDVVPAHHKRTATGQRAKERGLRWGEVAERRDRFCATDLNRAGDRRRPFQDAEDAVGNRQLGTLV